MPVWNDVTSWSQGDTKEARAIPRTWEMKVGKLRIIITRHRHYEPDAWVMNVYGPITIDEDVLASKDVDDAKREAMVIVAEIMRGLCALADVLDPRP